MAPTIRIARAATAAALALLAVPAAAGPDRASNNRSMASVHQPVVSRTDFTFDLAGGPRGLAPGEAQRLSGWFDGLGVGAGDTVAVDDPAHGDAADAVGTVLARYGMLLSAGPAPAGVAPPAPGTVRVVVSRAIARVDGCPDWSRGNWSEYEGALPSNYGCASAQNLAAMIANPQDLVHGAAAGPAGDARVVVKAIQTWREAKTTGAAGLPGGVMQNTLKGTN